jgi:hypothetical protein
MTGSFATMLRINLAIEKMQFFYTLLHDLLRWNWAKRGLNPLGLLEKNFN